MARSFNNVAWAYDALSFIVFGRTIRKAQTELLVELSNVESILVIGGGTGWILEPLIRELQPQTIVYIDASEKMIAKAERKFGQMKDIKNCNVDFRTGSLEKIRSDEKFDLIITNFFFDMFRENEILEIIGRIKGVMSREAKWYLSDFRYCSDQPMKVISRLLVGTMYAFFRVTTGIAAGKLEDFHGLMKRSGMKPLKNRYYYGKMIESAVYRLSEK